MPMLGLLDLLQSQAAIERRDHSAPVVGATFNDSLIAPAKGPADNGYPKLAQLPCNAAVMPKTPLFRRSGTGRRPLNRGTGRQGDPARNQHVVAAVGQNLDHRSHLARERLIGLNGLDQKAPTLDVNDRLVAVDFDDPRAKLGGSRRLRLRPGVITEGQEGYGDHGRSRPAPDWRQAASEKRAHGYQYSRSG